MNFNVVTNSEQLDDFLDIETPVAEIVEDAVEVIAPEGNTSMTATDETAQIDAEYSYAQENLHNIIDKGAMALDELLLIARQSDQPRAYEVVGSLVKTLTDANKDLLELKNKQQTLKGEKATSAKNVTNALFVGSTSELQKMLKKVNNGDG